jgi:hypothetical protein
MIGYMKSKYSSPTTSWSPARYVRFHVNDSIRDQFVTASDSPANVIGAFIEFPKSSVGHLLDFWDPSQLFRSISRVTAESSTRL